MSDKKSTNKDVIMFMKNFEVNVSCKVCMLRINKNKDYNHSLEEDGRRPLISSVLRL